MRLYVSPQQMELLHEALQMLETDWNQGEKEHPLQGEINKLKAKLRNLSDGNALEKKNI